MEDNGPYHAISIINIFLQTSRSQSAGQDGKKQVDLIYLPVNILCRCVMREARKAFIKSVNPFLFNVVQAP